MSAMLLATPIRSRLICRSIFFVREEFARAVAATDLPHDFTLNDLHWPLPGMVVGFPTRFMLEYLGRDVCYVYAASCGAGDYQVPGLAGCPTVTVPQNKVGWQFYAWRDGNLESFVTSYYRVGRVDESALSFRSPSRCTSARLFVT